MKKLISIIGTTGIGKTALSIHIAQHFGAEIVSCDSRQFFREMPIGTAAPTAEELAQVPHHFVGHLSVQNYYSIGQYEKDAIKKVAELFKRNDVVVLVGGSMMYEKAVIEGLNDLPEANADHQQQLETILKEEGIEAVQALLKAEDPDYFEVVDKNNHRRLFRALDIIWQTGETYTESISAQIQKRDFEIIRIGIEAPREIIYDRINRRVTQMAEKGLMEEAQSLLPYRNLPALQTVGYSELFRYFDGEWTLDFALDEIRKNSRRFAKRQLTWYRKEQDIHWVNYENSLQESLSLLSKLNIKPSKQIKMANTPSNMLELGTKAPFFELPNPSHSNEIQSLDELKGEKGTLVIFMCNHCPFVLHVIDKLAELYEDYNDKGIEFIAINANDAEKYPADSPEKMAEFQVERKFEFPYLYDESQAIAKAYDAACTPDFFFFDDKLDLIYRGQMDDSRPGNQKEITGEDLIVAFENLLAGAPQEELQRPSMGCNIKWK